MLRPPKAKTAVDHSPANIGFEEDFDGVFVDGISSELGSNYVFTTPYFNEFKSFFAGLLFTIKG